MAEGVVIPGQRIGGVTEYDGGPGTYQRGNYLYSSLVGYKRILSFDQEEDQENERPIVFVSREKEITKVPDIGSIVTCKVTRVNTRYATVQIVCSNDKVLKEGYSGIIRVQDVRATEIDSKTEIYKSFRPGDIVRAEVLSLGDARSYYLTTGKNELGVIYAKSVAGSTMIPISWESMLCPKTKMKEFRKVAKPSNMPLQGETNPPNSN